MNLDLCENGSWGWLGDIHVNLGNPRLKKVIGNLWFTASRIKDRVRGSSSKGYQLDEGKGK